MQARWNTRWPTLLNSVSAEAGEVQSLATSGAASFARRGALRHAIGCRAVLSLGIGSLRRIERRPDLAQTPSPTPIGQKAVVAHPHQPLRQHVQEVAADELPAPERQRASNALVRIVLITYLWCDEGWMYLATVIDLFSRRVIGWSLSHRMTKQLVCDAMSMAFDSRDDVEGVIMHTDRGSQYCSAQFQRLLREHGARSSMSAKGDCFDNACAESFFHSLKVEAIHGERFETRESVRAVVFEYIEVYYNRTRRHTTTDNASPVEYEMAHAA